MANTTTNVGVVFTAVNNMTAGVNGVARDINRLQSTFNAITRAGAAVGGLYGVVSIIKDIGSEAMKQETSLNNLSSALGNLGTARTRELTSLTDYAKGLATISTYSTEEIQNEMARAKNMGVVTNQLDEAATAAIGLSKAYRMDLAAAMDLITKAANGQTAGLKRHGIVLADNLTQQEKLNAIYKIGYDNIHLATDELHTAAGAYKQTQKAISDTKVALGGEFLPVAQKVFESISGYLNSNQADMRAWASSTVNLLGWVGRNWISVTDTIVKDRADQWIEHTALEREAQERESDAKQRSRQAFDSRTYGMNGSGDQFIVSGTGTLPDIDNQSRWGSDQLSREQRITGINWARVREIEAQLRKESQDLMTSQMPDRTEIGSQYPLPSLTGNLPLSATGAANADIDEQKNLEKGLRDAERFARERERIYTRMYKDLKGMNQEAFTFGVELLNAEWERYEKYVTDKAVLNRWYQQQYRQLEIERMEAGDDWFKGFEAGTMKMEDELKTLGQLGADSAKQMRDAWVEGTMDMIFEAKSLNDVLRSMALDFAKMQMRAGLNQFYTQGMGAVGSGIGSYFGGYSGGWQPGVDMSAGWAKGGVFERGRVMPFGRGGVVSRPTLFPMADGAGLMGEDGPEGILPLRRGAGGRLGVESAGGSTKRMEALLERIAAKDLRPVVYMVHSKEEILNVLKSREGREVQLETGHVYGGR